MPVDFIVLDIDCNPSCPIILGRLFLRIIGAIIDMKEGNSRFRFPLRKGMEHFPINKIKFPYESIMRSTYGLHTKDGNTLLGTAPTDSSMIRLQRIYNFLLYHAVLISILDVL